LLNVGGSDRGDPVLALDAAMIGVIDSLDLAYKS
jgi:hypothetical protein